MRSSIPLFLGTLLLASCSIGRGSNEPIMHTVSPETLTATMALRVLREEGNKKTIAVVIQNPAGAPIRSIRSWVQFDSSSVHVSDLTIEDGRFSLIAPGERTIDSENGFVKIGVASKEFVQDSLVTLALFTITSRRTDDPPIVTFYDWREAGDGHTAVLTVQDGVAVNILNSPPTSDL